MASVQRPAEYMNYAKSIEEIAAQVDFASEEMQTAIAAHETWRPTAYDEALHERMGTSYATGTFKVIQWALRREMLMALMRIWDNEEKAVSLKRIVRCLRDPKFVAALSRMRAEATQGGFQRFLAEHLEGNYREKIDRVGQLFDKYQKCGDSAHVMKHLLTLRNTMLAHRQTLPIKPQRDATLDEIEQFYSDTRSIVECLLHVIKATALDTADTVGVYGTYAKYFWEGARGECTHGHPSYKGPFRPEDVGL
jgi:hypothetical protein